MDLRVYYTMPPIRRSPPTPRLPEDDEGLNPMPPRRLSGVFAVGIIPGLYRGPAPAYGRYFHSTMDASRFLGYSYDALGKELWQHRSAVCRGSAGLRGLVFTTATEAYRMADKQLEPHLRSVFPFLFDEWGCAPGRNRRRARPARLRPVGDAGQEQWDYAI